MGQKLGFIKSEKALIFERDAIRQIPVQARVSWDVPVGISLRIFYRSELPDLDESLLLDCLQDRYKTMRGQRILIQRGVYSNDRKVREKHVFHGIDKFDPRVEIEVWRLDGQGELA